jgi:hypothetical protein
MNLDGIKELLVVGCLPFANPGEPGFALPLLEHFSGSKFRAVQEQDEYLNVVAAFKTLEGSFETALSIAGPISHVGGELVHCFITEDGIPHAGTLPEIESVLRCFVTRRPTCRAISLQVMELVGSLEEKRSARLNMRQTILESQGPVAARAFYEGSALRAALWGRIVAAAPNREAASRILKARTQLIPRFTQGGRVDIDLTAIDSADYARTDAASLAAGLEQEFEYVGTDATTHKEKVIAAVNWIKRATRQEERIAMLLYDLLRQDEDTGREIFMSMRSRQGFENTVHDQLIGPIVRRRSRIKAEDIAPIISQMYKKAFPFGRGRLLWFLAKHLAEYPIINEAIQKLLYGSRSMFLDEYRLKIEEALHRASRAQHAAKPDFK